MKTQYEEWIKAKLATAESPFIKCKEWCEEMQEAFPELNVVRGTIFLTNGWERNHWWLLDGEEIVDPTASQFQLPYYGESCRTKILSYHPRDENEPEPTGLCPNCGGYCYDDKSVCSDRCGDAYAAYLNNPHML